MRFTTFPSIIALLSFTLATATATATTATTRATHNQDPSYDAFEFNPRHVQWLSQKFNRDPQQYETLSQDRRGNQEQTQTQTFTDPLGTQFTLADMDQFEFDIHHISSQNTMAQLFSPKDVFINACVDNILSPTVVQDELISQNDITNFLVTFCIDIGTCPQGFTTTFQALSLQLQLTFTRFNCPLRFDGPQDQECLDELKAQEGDEFGYVVKEGEEDDPVLEHNVKDMCTLFWRFGTEYHGGTQSPTTAPTSTPSILPTNVPSTLPSFLPSNLPSPSPSLLPSDAPSQSPSSQPSSSPSALPSLTLSVNPTDDPSGSPTDQPSTVPSPSPTLSQLPSLEPTQKPSFIGSFHPSESVQPSQVPTDVPSSFPSAYPSGSPSDIPSLEPSSSPSESPSTIPSGEPSTTPSSSPSGSPSDIPTLDPSSSPSDRPTQVPSSGPSLSLMPSVSPSGKPSFMGSWHPSVSVTPTSGPTSGPSVSPSVVPSVAPSSIPSSSPSASPSDLPSSSPSKSPSDIPSVSPSSGPSSSPSTMPSSLPTAEPSHQPTFPPGISNSPTATPSNVPSSSPSISAVPTRTQQPSESPTTTVPFRVDFTYIAGFNLTRISARSLDNAEEDVFIMDRVRGVLRQILALKEITRGRVLQKRIGFRGDDPQNSSIYHKDVKDEEKCPESFSESVSCVRVVSEIIVYANGDNNENSEVMSSVRTPIKNSMEGDNLFLQFLDFDSLKEIKYVGDGSVTITDPVVGPNGREPISQGGVAGIAVGAIFFVAAIALIAITRNRAEDDREDQPELQSSDGSSYGADIGGPESDSLTTGKASRSITEEPMDISRAAQIDVETGIVVPAVKSDGRSDSYGSSNYASSDDVVVSAVKSDGRSDSYGSSNYASSDDEGELLIGRLDAAVSAGDWVAVAAIAGDLSTADEASTMSSVNTSKFSDSRSRDNLNVEDAKRAAKIDQLVAEGDWSAVGATAAAFDDPSSASSSMLSEKSSGVNTAKNVNNSDGTKRSILDFIAGPWQSSAASKAMVTDDEEAAVEGLNISLQNDAVSSLSGGLSPDRVRDLEGGGPPATTFKPMMHPGRISESDTTDDETKPMIGKQTKKKGWKGRFTKIGKKSRGGNDDEQATKSLALQEDSSVSSWSQGSPDSPEVKKLRPYSNDKSGPGEDAIPEEMKAFGEDFGLLAAELALRQEEEAKDIAVSEDDVISQKSSNSLRDELDRAIESGDWAAVEAQTNKMFEDAVDDLDDSPRKRSHTASSNDIDSDVDDDDDISQEGWSTTSKSMVSEHSEAIDDDRIAMLEQLIETDDWQGIVSDSRIHNRDDSSMADSSIADSSMASSVYLPDDKKVESLLSPLDDDDTEEG